MAFRCRTLGLDDVGDIGSGLAGGGCDQSRIVAVATGSYISRRARACRSGLRGRVVVFESHPGEVLMNEPVAANLKRLRGSSGWSQGGSPRPPACPAARSSVR